MKKIFIILIFTLSFFYLFFIRPTSKELQRLRNLKIKDIDISKLKDGNYLGEFVYGKNTKTKLEVIIKDSKILEINVFENGKTEYAQKAVIGIKESILKKQKNNVDVIAGASTTSKAVLKAIENALSNAEIK